MHSVHGIGSERFAKGQVWVCMIRNPFRRRCAMMTIDVISAGLFGYATAGAAYLVLFLLALRWWNHDLSGLLLIIASILTAIWAGVTTYSLHATANVGPVPEALEASIAVVWRAGAPDAGAPAPPAGRRRACGAARFARRLDRL